MQTIGASGIDGVPGGVTQVKEVAAALIRVAKTRNITTMIVGHVTKDGSIAGPRVLEHLVDVVLHFEGDRNSRFRMVRAMKNRYGPIDEVGCFDLSSEGISAVTDPTGLFVEHHTQDVSGTCVAVTMEGRRPLLAEVQALLTPSPLERPRRTVSGVESSRVDMVLAVLQRHARLRIAGSDTFVATVGGAKLHDPAADLAIAVAVASSHLGVPAAARCRRDRRDRPGRRAAARARPAAAHRGGRPSRLQGRGRPPRTGPAQRARHPLAADGRRTPGGRGRRRRGRAADPGPDPSALTCRSGARARLSKGSVDRASPPLHFTRWAHGGAPRRQHVEDPVAERIDDQLRLRATLASIAPGTPLRDGLERILRGRTGALIVLGLDKTVESISTGGFTLDVPFTATGLRELAKMDGAIVIDKDITRIHRRRCT